jgi:hypothetical protein
MKFRQNGSDQEVIHYVLRSTNLILFGVLKICHNTGGNTFILYMKKVKQMTVVITEGYHCYQLHTTFCPAFFSQFELHTQKKL